MSEEDVYLHAIDTIGRLLRSYLRGGSSAEHTMEAIARAMVVGDDEKAVYTWFVSKRVKSLRVVRHAEVEHLLGSRVPLAYVFNQLYRFSKCRAAVYLGVSMTTARRWRNLTTPTSAAITAKLERRAAEWLLGEFGSADEVYTTLEHLDDMFEHVRERR